LAKEEIHSAALLLFEAKMSWPQSKFHRRTHSGLFPINGEARQSDAAVHVPTHLAVASSAINFFILAFGSSSASQEWWRVAGRWGRIFFSFPLEKMTSSLKGQEHILIMYRG
jgi:hypothetical protein